MSSTVTFDGEPPEGTINLGIGQPSADMLPVGIMAQASAAFFEEAQPQEFNYGTKEGDERFLVSVSRLLTNHYDHVVSPDGLFLTGGNSQALDLVSSTFAKGGDTVFVEEPSYFLAFQIFRDHGLKVVGIPTDEEGMQMDALRHALKHHQPAFVYTIPSYHNPGGQCLSRARRLELVELSQQHNFVIVADEVYQMLYYEGAPPPAMGTLIDSGTVLSLGSFSKILAPGLRLGWIQTCDKLRDRLGSNGFVNSGGSINHISSHIVRKALDLGLQDQHLETLKATYRARVAAMESALQAHFSELAQWDCPTGGYFFWLRFDPSVDTTPLREQALVKETGFQPGSVFSSSGGLQNYLRLSFAHYAPKDIEIGIERMRPLFD